VGNRPPFPPSTQKTAIQKVRLSEEAGTGSLSYSAESIMLL
jgi:nuclear transport factor 2 (NTF2) superfamily protein